MEQVTNLVTILRGNSSELSALCSAFSYTTRTTPNRYLCCRWKGLLKQTKKARFAFCAVHQNAVQVDIYFFYNFSFVSTSDVLFSMGRSMLHDHAKLTMRNYFNSKFSKENIQ